MDRYLPRIADKILAFKLKTKGAILVEGPKWCGKSTTCLRQAKSVIEMLRKTHWLADGMKATESE